MTHRPPLFFAVLTALLLGPGCIATSARFVQTDKSFQARPRSAPPKVFLDRAPDISFASVGIVEAQGVVTTPADALITTAVSKATDLGCDVLVNKALYEKHSRIGRRTYPNGIAAWLFVCGVFDPTKQSHETARLAAAAAHEIVRREYGEPVCDIEDLTGSHIGEEVCRLPMALSPIVFVY